MNRRWAGRQPSWLAELQESAGKPAPMRSIGENRSGNIMFSGRFIRAYPEFGEPFVSGFDLAVDVVESRL